MGRILFYLVNVIAILNIFCAIIGSSIIFGIINTLVAIVLFTQMLTYDIFKPYREEIKNAGISILQWFKK